MTAAEFASIACAAGLLERIADQSASSYNPVWMNLGIEASRQASDLHELLAVHVAHRCLNSSKACAGSYNPATRLCSSYRR